MAALHIAPPLSVRLVPVLPMQLSDKIMLAYRDPNLSASEFEAIVREIYGDGPFEDEGEF